MGNKDGLSDVISISEIKRGVKDDLRVGVALDLMPSL